MLLNIVHRHVRKTWAKQTIPNEQRRFWATRVNRNNLRSGFPSSLFVWEAKRKVSSSFPSADLRPFPEKRTAHRKLQPEVGPVPFQYALTISVRLLQTLRRFAWKFGKTTAQKTKRPLPADVLRSKSAQLTRVPIVARAVGEGPN